MMNAKIVMAAVLAALLLGACHKGRDGASAAPPPPPAGSSDWDRMVWDQDNWG